MTPERWQQVKAIFHSALQYEPTQRSAFLANACSDDRELRNEVESLIAAHEGAGSFIESPAFEAVASLMKDDQAELEPGHSIGPYEILSLLGKGGMGQVYLAKDNRLGRKVALKFLSTPFFNDRNRARRFEQEARTASGLNQPNILTIHEIGEIDGRRFIATEYIEGETLRHRLMTDPPKLAEALSIAEQITAALVAAHAVGIVHRDIKPENIMLRHDGIVKVLDFGLAKLAEEKGASPEAETRSAINTGAGLVMGTIAYMSPEQARGISVDARSDIWSLGVVFYEMISGKRPFEGKTNSDVLVSVLEREPEPLDIGALRIPETLEFIITKALTKDRDGRYQSAQEFLTDIKRLSQRLHLTGELERRGSADVKTSSPPKTGGTTYEISIQDTRETTRVDGFVARLRNHWLATGALVLIVFGASIGGYLLLTARQTGKLTYRPPEILRTTQITTRTGLEIPALSPDGNSIAYSSRPEEGSSEIYVRPLTPGAREIQLTSDGERNLEPAWSPDGKWIAYRSAKRGGIWTIPATGGTAKQLTDFGAVPTWSKDGSAIAFQSESHILPPTTIWTVSSQGGDPIQITHPGAPLGGHSTPAWSPDGTRIMFVAYGGSFDGQLWSVAAKGGDLRQVVRDNSTWFKGPVYSPDGKSIYTGAVTAAGNFVLYKIAISPISGEAADAPELIKDTGLAYVDGSPTISADGKKLVFVTRVPSGDVMSVPISPTTGEAQGPPKPLTQSTGYRKAIPSFSRDGDRIAYQQWSGGENQKIWVMDANGANARQLTSEPTVHWSPTWLPDNDTIVFIAHRSGGGQSIRTISVSTGRQRLLFDVRQDIGWLRVSPDGKQLAFNSNKGGTINIWTMPVTGGEPRQLTFDNETIGWPSWSPDGKLLAVQIRRGSDYYLATIPSSGGQITQLIFDRGGVQPNDWSPDGDKILFAGLRGGVWNVYWYSLSTKEQKQLTHYTKNTHYVRYPSWSPKGDQIIYEYSEISGNIWLLELK